MDSPLAVYGGLLGDPDGGEALVRFSDGRVGRALLDRWLGSADAADERVLGTVAGPVLDVGCGPGRHLQALGLRGVPALGIDLSPAAVGLARRRGAEAVVGSVFEEVPEAGQWASALLLDGNIGIGGSPERLLRRIRGLLLPGGRVAVEVDPPGQASRGGQIRLERGGLHSEWFPWAEVAAGDVGPILTRSGFRVVAHLSEAERWFAIADAVR